MHGQHASLRTKEPGAPDACSAVSFPYKQLTELLAAVLLALYGGFKHVTISPDMKLGQQTR